MKEHYKTQGIILKKQDVGEAHRVFTAFTKDFGKIQLWAISERKIVSKLRGGLELFYCSKLEFVEGKNKKVLVEALCINPFLSLRKDLQRLRAAFKIAALIDRLIGGQEQDKKIWNLLLQSFHLLNEGFLPQAVYHQFASFFLELAGYGNTKLKPL